MPTLFVTDANVWVARYNTNDVNYQVSQTWITATVTVGTNSHALPG